MKPVAQLVIEMAANVARLEKDMSRARNSVDGAMRKIQASVRIAMRALGALGLGLGAAQLVGFVRSAINAGDQMQKLSQQIGVATENISGLQMAFRQGGSNAGEMQMAMARLSLGVNNQTAVYKKLGIQSKDTLGALMEVADIVQQMPDGLEKSAIANELFGRSGAKLIPILNQGSQGLRNYIELSQRLGTSVTPELGKQFELYNDTLDTVGEAMRGLAMQASAALIPTLQAVATALQSAFESGSVQRGIEMMVEAVKLLGLVLGARLIASIAGVAGSLVAMAAGMTTATVATGGFTFALTAMKGVMALMGGPIGLIASAAGALIYFSEKAYRAETTAEGLAEKLGMTNEELRTMTQLQIEQKIVDIALELQKLELQSIKTAAAQALLNEQLSDPEAYAFSGGQLSTELGTINKKTAAFQELLETLKNRLVDTTKESKVTASNLGNLGKSATKTAESIADLITKYRQETDALIMSTDEKERAAFTQELLNKDVKEGTKAYKEYLDLFDVARIERRTLESQMQSIEREKQANEERLQERVRQEEEFASEAQRINDQIGQSLTDALMTGGKNAKDYLIDLFRTLVLRPILQPIISGVLGAIGIGGAGAALAGEPDGGAMSQATGLAGLVSTVKSAVDMVTGGFAAIGASVSNLAVEGGFQLISAGFTEAGASMINASAALGSAASVMAGVGAGLTAGTMISGQYKVGGDQMIATGIGTAIGLAVGGPLGAAVGGALGGVVNRAFGMGKTTTEASGITGELTLEGALAEQFIITKQKGGWFRSDKVRKSYTALESDVLDRLSATAQNVGLTVISMAESLGLSAEKVQGFSREFTLDFKGLSEEEISQAIEQEFGFFADSLAETIEPALANFRRGAESTSQIIARLSNVLTTVNQSFDILGFSLYETSLAGADAAQKMLDLFGGIENFSASTSFYYENFYNDQERVNKQLEQMTSLFKTMGIVLPNSNNEFREMVEAAKAAGNESLFASLIQLAPAFNNLTSALEELKKVASEDTNAAFARLQLSLRAQLDSAINSARNDLRLTIEMIDAQREAASVARNVVSESIGSIGQVFDTLKSEINGLASAISVTQTSGQARLFLTQALQTARTTGYLPDADDLSVAISQARGGLGAESFVSAFEQQREQMRLRNELIELQSISGDQLTEAERQLLIADQTLESLDTQAASAQIFYEQSIAQAQTHHDQQLQAAQNQIDALRGVDNKLLSVFDAINLLASSMRSEAAVSIGGSASGTRAQEITNMYQEILRRQPEPAGLDFWMSYPGSLQEIRRLIGESEEAQRLRGFANGGYASMGMAMVGERGPELVDFNRPAQVYTNNELRSAMGGGDSSAEIRALREENRAQSRAMVSMQSRMTRIIEQWNGDGLPQERFEGQTA